MRSHHSFANFCLTLVATAAVAVRIAKEERFLAKQHPEYRANATRTKRIVPFLLLFKSGAVPALFFGARACRHEKGET
jgi:hypothetical protein